MDEFYPTTLRAEGHTGGCFECVHRLCAYLPGANGASHQVFRRFERGERLPFERDDCHLFWIIVSGTAATCTTLADGRRQIVRVEMSGDIICGVSPENDTEGWLEALSHCRICEIALMDADAALHDDSRFLGTLFRQLHVRLDGLAAHIVLLGRLDSMERICLFLADMARRGGVMHDNTIRVSLAMSREDIADYLGLNAETVSRLMGRVKKAGLAIFLSPTEYVVPDIAALERRVPIAPRPHSDGRTVPQTGQVGKGIHR